MKIITTVIGIECTTKDNKQIGLIIRGKLPEGFKPVIARKVQDDNILRRQLRTLEHGRSG